MTDLKQNKTSGGDSENEVEIESEEIVEIQPAGNQTQVLSQTPVRGANFANQNQSPAKGSNNTPKRYTSLKDLQTVDRTVLKQRMETEDGAKQLRQILLRTGKVMGCKCILDIFHNY